MMDVPTCDKTIKCTVFEDNISAIDLAKAPKMRPRINYAAVKCRYFRSYAQKGDIIIKNADASE